MTARADRPIADELERRGLGAAAELLIGAHRPLRPLLEDLATVAEPILRPLLGDRLHAVRRELDELLRDGDEL
ncbi:MAG: hypothetical protein ABI622_01235 [Chloroflexota bacterium]